MEKINNIEDYLKQVESEYYNTSDTRDEHIPDVLKPTNGYAPELLKPTDEYHRQYPNNSQSDNQVTTKSMLSSKTVWTGFATTSISMIAYLQGTDIIQSNPKAASLVGTLIGVMMIALRFLTNEPIKPPTIKLGQ